MEIIREMLSKTVGNFHRENFRQLFCQLSGSMLYLQTPTGLEGGAYDMKV